MKFKNDKRFKSFIVTLIVAILLVTVIPIPYYVEKPGTSENLRDYVSVDGKRDKFDGSFMLTTVAVQQATIASLISGHLNHTNDVISKKEMMGTNSGKEYEEMQHYHMETSQNIATKLALDLAKKPYKVDYKGIYVMSIDEHSNFENKLRVGDTIVKVDNQKIERTEDLTKYIKTKKVDDSVKITYEQDGKTKETKGDLIKLPETKKAGIGITLVDHTEIDTKEEINFSTESIGGPSAGLMFTLELYSLITGKDLRNGQDIAGTGTIDSEGVVGRIGGIDKKVIAADHEGADIFFAPNDEIDPEIKKKNPDVKTNYEEAVESAKKNHLEVKIVPVKTVKDAIKYLEKGK